MFHNCRPTSLSLLECGITGYSLCLVFRSELARKIVLRLEWIASVFGILRFGESVLVSIGYIELIVDCFGCNYPIVLRLFYLFLVKYT